MKRDNFFSGGDFSGSNTQVVRVNMVTRAATTAALAASTYDNNAGTLTENANGALAAQDGITLVVGDRLLVKDQASGLQNGVYSVTQVGSAGTPFILTRTSDANTSGLMVPGMLLVVTEGSAGGDKLYELATDGPITLGTTALTWSLAGGGGGGVTGSGTTNRLSKFTGATAVGDSSLSDDGTTVTRTTSDSTMAFKTSKSTQGVGLTFDTTGDISGGANDQVQFNNNAKKMFGIYDGSTFTQIEFFRSDTGASTGGFRIDSAADAWITGSGAGPFDFSPLTDLLYNIGKVAKRWGNAFIQTWTSAEQTAPSAPAALSMTLFVRSNGVSTPNHRTQLCVMGSDGVVIVLAETALS